MVTFDQSLRGCPWILTMTGFLHMASGRNPDSIFVDRHRAAGTGQVVGAMHGDIRAAAKLLADLRDAYRGLPQPIQLRIRYLLREWRCPGFEGNAPLPTIFAQYAHSRGPVRAAQGKAQ